MFFTVLDYFIDIIFFFDIIVQFFSAYELKDETIVSDMKTIAKTYLKSWFVMDLFTWYFINLLISFIVYHFR